MLEIIGNNETGLANNLNCTFFRSNLEEINISFCYSYIIDIYSLSILIILMSSFGFCSATFLYFSTTRYIHNDIKINFFFYLKSD